MPAAGSFVAGSKPPAALCGSLLSSVGCGPWRHYLRGSRQQPETLISVKLQAAQLREEMIHLGVSEIRGP